MRAVYTLAFLLVKRIATCDSVIYSYGHRYIGFTVSVNMICRSKERWQQGNILCNYISVSTVI